MKKFLVLLLTLILAVIGAAGCSVGGEKPIDVAFVYNGNVVATKTVTIFKNQLTPEEAEVGIEVPHGYKFMGWSTDENWQYSQKETNPVIGAVVHRSDIEKAAKDGKVTLYAIIIDKSEIPKSDLVIGWYAKTSTSGLKANMIDKTEAAFAKYLSENSDAISAYLTEKGKTLEELDIVYRAYEGDVATIGANINADEDVNVLLGVYKNITSVGGVATSERNDNIPMGTKTRSVALVAGSETNELAVLFYAWAQTEEAFACWAA